MLRGACCAVLCCAVLRSAALCCVLCCAVLCCAVLRWTVEQCTAVCCFKMCDAVLCCACCAVLCNAEADDRAVHCCVLFSKCVVPCCAVPVLPQMFRLCHDLLQCDKLSSHTHICSSCWCCAVLRPLNQSCLQN